MKCENCNKEMQGYSVCTLLFGICTDKKCKNYGLMRMCIEESKEYTKEFEKKWKKTREGKE